MRTGTTLVFGVIAGFLIGMVVIYGITQLQSSNKNNQYPVGRDGIESPRLNSPAPEINLESLSGEWVQLSDQKGKIVLINFWATWCGPCRLEMPILQSRFERYPDDLIILAVNENDAPRDIRAFMSEYRLTFDVLLDPGGDVHQQYLVRGFPSSFLVDRDGLLRVQHVGLMAERQLDEYLFDLGLPRK